MKINKYHLLGAITGALLGSLIGVALANYVDKTQNLREIQGAERDANLLGTFGARSLPIVMRPGLASNHSVYTPTAEGTIAKAKYRIGVIDTGYDGNQAPLPTKLCKDGHYDFYTESAVIASAHPHGTMVTTLIAEPLAEADYCVVVFQVVDHNGVITPDNVARAIMLASKQSLAAVNISLSGPNSAMVEQRALRELTKSGAQVFVAVW